jgi:hypothetical protein
MSKQDTKRAMSSSLWRIIKANKVTVRDILINKKGSSRISVGDPRYSGTDTEQN